MVGKKYFKIIWDQTALVDFKEILKFLYKQNPQAPGIIKEAVLDNLDLLKSNGLIFESDKLKEGSNKEFRAFVVYSYRITYQIKSDLKEIRVIRIRHTSREPFGY